MDRKQAQARLDRIHDTPARNWRERRQKARVMAAAYRRSKPLLCRFVGLPGDDQAGAVLGFRAATHPARCCPRPCKWAT